MPAEGFANASGLPIQPLEGDRLTRVSFTLAGQDTLYSR